jgi:hypothetical protein
MLTARGAAREKGKFFSLEMRYDILAGDRPIGLLVYQGRKRRGVLTLDGAEYAIGRESDRGPENLFQMVARGLTGRQKPPPNPFLLRDAGQRVLATALPVGSRFEVSRSEARFDLKRASIFSRPYQLHPAGNDQPVGWVGQQKFFTKTLTMDLPPEFDSPFQVFLLTVVLDLALQQSSSD